LPIKPIGRKLLPGPTLLADSEVLIVQNPVVRFVFALVITEFIPFGAHAILASEISPLAVFYCDLYN
jgi:hypothetical protein